MHRQTHSIPPGPRKFRENQRKPMKTKENTTCSRRSWVVPHDLRPEIVGYYPRSAGENRENGTNPAAKRPIPDLVSNGKCKNRIAAQGITTFPDFAHHRPLFGIIVCNQNSHSRPGKTRDCQFWKGQNHRSIRSLKSNLISGNVPKPSHRRH